MGLRHGDLTDTLLHKISIDEYQPKTGDAKDVVVFAFNVMEENVGWDLYNFISSGTADVRDIEVSPNPNDQGYYMVFMELDRNDRVLDHIRKIVRDVENVSGKLKWAAKTHLTDDFYPLFDDQISEFVLSNPDNYMTKEEWEQHQASVVPEPEEEVPADYSEALEFLRPSNLHSVDINEDIINMESRFDTAQLRLVKFGDAKEVMAELGISESAIKPLDSTLRKFNSMLGEMRAIPIQDYIVIFHPQQNNVMVTQIC